jgi:hypothetical protein
MRDVACYIAALILILIEVKMHGRLLIRALLNFLKEFGSSLYVKLD